MFRLVVLNAFLALCHGHAVPVLAPVHHTAVVAPVVAGYTSHGYGGHGFGGSGYGGLGYGGLNNAELGHGGLGYGGLGHAGLGYGGFGGFGGHGYAGHGLLAKSVGHHILKRSPHLVAPLSHVAHVAPVAVSPVAHIAPVAVSHQSRLDLHSSPAVVTTSVVQPVVAPVLHAAPLLHKSFVAAPLHFGAGLGGGIAGGHYGHGYGYH